MTESRTVIDAEGRPTGLYGGIDPGTGKRIPAADPDAFVHPHRASTEPGNDLLSGGKAEDRGGDKPPWGDWDKKYAEVDLLSGPEDPKSLAIPSRGDRGYEDWEHKYGEASGQARDDWEYKYGDPDQPPTPKITDTVATDTTTLGSSLA